MAMETWLCIAVFLACALLSSSGQPMTCYKSEAGCVGTSFPANSSESCCLSDGQFMIIDGEVRCLPCLVYGWLDGPLVSAREQFRDHIYSVGYIKGSTRREATRRQFGVEAIEGTAVMGRGNDFLLKTTNVSPRPRQIEAVMVAIYEDQIALELNETFQLKLTELNPQAVQVNEVFLDTINVTIIDEEEVNFYFTESDYRGREDAGEIPVAVERDVKIASPVTLRVVPMNHTQFLSSGLPIPRDVPPFDRFSPNRAKSFPLEERDFSDKPIRVTFVPNGLSRDQQQLSILVPNEEVNEANEFFFVVLELVEGVNRVVLEQQSISLCRIVDSDVLKVGFEFPEYVFTEQDGTFPDAIRLVKEDGKVSEQIFEIKITIESGLRFGRQDATFKRSPSDKGDYKMTTEQFRFEFPPEEQLIPLPLTLFDDHILEQTEVFVLQLERIVDQGPQFDAGLYLIALVKIQDNDFVKVGFETSEPLIVDEDIGVVEFCLRVFSPRQNESLPFSFYLVVETLAQSAGPGDYEQLNIDTLLLEYFSEDIRRQCFNLTVIDDRTFEETESLVLSVYLDLFELSPPALEISPNVTMVEIIDNDLVTVAFSKESQTLYLKLGETEICVARDKVTDDDITLELTHTAIGNNGSWLLDIVPQNLTFTPEGGYVLCSIVHIINAENLPATADVWIRPVKEGVQVGDPSILVIIPLELEVELTHEVYSVSEGNGSVTVCVQSNTRAEDPIQVLISATLTAAKNAASAEDFIPEAKLVVIEGDSTECTDFRIIDDELGLEGTEIFAVGATLPIHSPSVLGNVSQAIVAIEDDDELTLDFEKLAYATTEPFVPVCLDKDGETLDDISMDVFYSTFALHDGLILTATSQQLIVYANETRLCVDINVTDAEGIAWVQTRDNFTIVLTLQVNNSGVSPRVNWTSRITVSSEGSQQASTGRCQQSSAATTALVITLVVVTAVAAIITIAAIVRHHRRGMVYKVSSADSAKGLEENRKERGRREKDTKNTYRLLSSSVVLDSEVWSEQPQSLDPSTAYADHEYDEPGHVKRLTDVYEYDNPGSHRRLTDGPKADETDDGNTSSSTQTESSEDAFDEKWFLDGAFAPYVPDKWEKTDHPTGAEEQEVQCNDVDKAQQSDDPQKSDQSDSFDEDWFQEGAFGPTLHTQDLTQNRARPTALGAPEQDTLESNEQGEKGEDPKENNIAEELEAIHAQGIPSIGLQRENLLLYLLSLGAVVAVPEEPEPEEDSILDEGQDWLEEKIEEKLTESDDEDSDDSETTEDEKETKDDSLSEEEWDTEEELENDATEEDRSTRRPPPHVNSTPVPSNVGLKVLVQPHTQCVTSSSALQRIRYPASGSKWMSHTETHLLSVCFQMSQGIEYLAWKRVQLGKLSCSILARFGVKLGNCNFCAPAVHTYNMHEAAKPEQQSTIEQLSGIIKVTKDHSQMATGLGYAGDLSPVEVITCLEKVHEVLEYCGSDQIAIARSICDCLGDICTQWQRKAELQMGAQGEVL